MNKLNYFYYAALLYYRDKIYASVFFLSSGTLFYFLFLSLGLAQQNNIENGTLKSIGLLFTYLCLLLLGFNSIFQILQSTGNIGIILAVGGNRIGCIYLLLIREIISCLPGFFAAMVVFSIYTPPFIQWKIDLVGTLLLYLRSSVYAVGALVIAGVPVSTVVTMVDPYISIRRQK